MEPQQIGNSVVLSLGNYSIYSSKSGYQKLLEFYESCKNYENRNIEIDFSQLDFFDANLSAVLFSILYKLNLENGLTFSFDINFIKEKFNILTRNGFIDDEITLNKDSNTFVRLQAFDQENDKDFINYVTNDLFENPGLMKMERELKHRMILNLFEVYANVSHSRTEHPIFACGQFFPKINRLKFTLVDLGVGFYKPIKELLNGDIVSPKEALQWALKEGKSTKINEPGGFGLSDLHKFCLESGSHMNIMTDGIVWGTDFGKIGAYNIVPYVGSTVTIDFDCN